MSKVWDIRFTDEDGVTEWFGDLMDESVARTVASDMSAGLYGPEYQTTTTAVNRMADLVSRFPVGSRVLSNPGTEWERLGTVRNHELYARFPQPYEALVIVPDEGRVATLLASHVVLAEEKRG